MASFNIGDIFGVVVRRDGTGYVRSARTRFSARQKRIQSCMSQRLGGGQLRGKSPHEVRQAFRAAAQACRNA